MTEENMNEIQSDEDQTLSADESTEKSQHAGTAETEQEEFTDDETLQNEDSETDDSGSDSENADDKKSHPTRLPKWAKDRVERSKRRVEELEQKLYAQQEELLELERKRTEKPAAQETVNYDPNTQIVDPFTGQVIAIDSVEGRLIVKLQQAAEIQQKQEIEVKKAKEQQTLKEKLAKGIEKFDDYKEVVTDLPFTQTMLEAAALSDKADEFVYQLGKYNRDEVVRITKLSPKEQFREIVLLENKFSKQKVAAKPTSEPPSEIKASGYIEKEPENMSFDDLVALRRKKERGQ